MPALLYCPIVINLLAARRNIPGKYRNGKGGRVVVRSHLSVNVQERNVNKCTDRTSSAEAVITIHIRMTITTLRPLIALIQRIQTSILVTVGIVPIDTIVHHVSITGELRQNENALT
jgi:hypothetical protein